MSDHNKMTKAEVKKKEDIVKGMKKNFKDFRQNYGDRAKEVMYATATKMATEETDEDIPMPVYHDVFGEGIVLEDNHAEPDENGQIEWFTVQFNHGTETVFAEDVHEMFHRMYERIDEGALGTGIGAVGGAAVGGPVGAAVGGLAGHMAQKGLQKLGKKLKAGYQAFKKPQTAEEVEVDEELTGNQHKIDANKNGRIDAQDFKLLKKIKKARG